MTNTVHRWTAEVAGMTCDACARHVAAAVQASGGSEAEVVWQGGTATFAAAEVDEQGLSEAVSEAGYELRSVRRVGRLEVLRSGGDAEFDLAVIGAGSAAFAAAIKATEAGARVVMIEKGTPGGTCVNVGCVPSKALLAAADTHHRARHHTVDGVPHSTGEADLAAIVAAKDELVDALRQAKYVDLVADYGFELRAGTVTFLDADTISVDGTPLTAANYLIATGARPALPPIEGLDLADHLTSTTALELTALPSRLAVIGANAIGLELGQAFSQLGTEVIFLDIAERIAPFEEPEISAALTQVLLDGGAQVVTGAQIKRASQAADGTVTLEGDLADLGSSLEVDRVLVATGRTPNTAELNLAAAGVEVDGRGFVAVDEHLRTTNPRVWAAGDVTASAQFVYVSAAEGAIAAANAIGGEGRTTDYRTLPRVMFTSPQVAAVGLTEAQAAAAGHNTITSVLPLSHVPRAIVNGDTRGVIKLVADATTDRLLGVHVLADGAGEVVQAGVYALMARLTVKEIAGAFHPYLTMAEGLKLAAQTFNRDVAKLSCCAA
jgi:mercuric reductase